MRELLFVLDSTFAQDSVFKGTSRAVLLLELGVGGVEAGRLGARYAFKSKLFGV